MHVFGHMCQPTHILDMCSLPAYKNDSVSAMKARLNQ